jgi:hypothetical protein
VKDFARVMTDDKKSERLANILGESSEVPKAFQRSVNQLGLGGRIVMGVVNRLVEAVL